MSTERYKERVEELDNFPFKNIQELKQAISDGAAQVMVDRSVALKWATSGKYAPRWLGNLTIFLSLLPFLTAIGFIGFAIYTKTWILLIALPILFIAYFVFHPGFARLIGFIHWLFVLAMFGCLAWGVYKQISWLIVLMGALVVIWWANKQIYQKSVNTLVRTACNNEDLFCILWQGKATGISFFNGDRYYVDHKFIDGKYVGV